MCKINKMCNWNKAKHRVNGRGREKEKTKKKQANNEQNGPAHWLFCDWRINGGAKLNNKIREWEKIVHKVIEENICEINEFGSWKNK